MMSLSTVKDSGRKLSPYSDDREGDTGEEDIMQSKQQMQRRLRLGASNLRTLLEAGKLENLKEEIRKQEDPLRSYSLVSAIVCLFVLIIVLKFVGNG